MTVENVGYPCNSAVDEWAFTAAGDEAATFISEYNNVSIDSRYSTFCIRISGTELPNDHDIYLQFAFYEKEDIGGGYYKFTRSSTSDKFKITRTDNEDDTYTYTANTSDVWFTKNSEDPYQQTVTFESGDVILTKLHNQNVEALDNEYLGVMISGAEWWNYGCPPYYEWGYWLEDKIDSKLDIGGYYYTFEGNDYSYRTDEDPFGHAAETLALSNVGVSGTVPDACDEDTETEYYINDTINLYGSITINGFSGSDAVTTVVTPWSESLGSETFQHNVTRQFDDASGKQHWSVKLRTFIGSPSFVYEPYECWWSDKTTYYVKTTGSDSNFGGTWATAFATVTKGAQTVPNGGTLMIEEGTYNNETQVQPTADNATYHIQPTSHTEAACTVTINIPDPSELVPSDTLYPSDVLVPF